MSSDKKDIKYRTICSGCFRKDKAVTKISDFLQGDFETINLGIKCCSYECAKSIESKKRFKMLVSFAAHIPKFAYKWNTAQRLYDDLETKAGLENYKQLYEIVIGTIVWNWRTNPICFETTDMLTIPILMMLNSDFKTAYYYIKLWIINKSAFKKDFLGEDLLMKYDINENLHESFNKILQDRILDVESRVDMKYTEHWRCFIAILLARLKIYVIEDMENLLLEKREFFRRNRISSLFPNRQNIPDTLAIFLLGCSDRNMRRELKNQEKHLAHIFESIADKNYSKNSESEDAKAEVLHYLTPLIPFLPVVVMLLYFLFHRFVLALPVELLWLILSMAMCATLYLLFLFEWNTQKS